MEENTEITLEESIQLLLSQVPEPVRNFVLNELQGTTQVLMERYHLHVDQGGVLERELLLMLLGQEEPAEFVETLKAAGIPADLVANITTDVNRDVFMRLREEERKVAAQPVQEKLSRPAALPPPSIVAPAPVEQTVVARSVPPPPPNLPGQEPVFPQPVTPPSPVLPQTAAAPIPAPAMEQPIVTRTMAHDMDALKHGTNPMVVAHPDFPPPVSQPVETPASQQTTRPAPQPIKRPRYDSISEPGLSSPVFRPHTFAPPSSMNASAPYPMAAPASGAQAPISKEYGADPYREPVA